MKDCSLWEINYFCHMQRGAFTCFCSPESTETDGLSLRLLSELQQPQTSGCRPAETFCLRLSETRAGTQSVAVLALNLAHNVLPHTHTYILHSLLEWYRNQHTNCLCAARAVVRGFIFICCPSVTFWWTWYLNTSRERLQIWQKWTQW